MSYQIWNGWKGGGLCIFVHESLCYNICKDLCSNNYDIETLAIEIANKRYKNIIQNVIHRQPNGDLKVSENHLMISFPKMKKVITK